MASDSCRPTIMEFGRVEVEQPIRREHDSIDDFEHLEPDAPKMDPPPPIISTQSFLDTEREEVIVSAPHLLPDDSFADSREELSPAPSDDSLPDAIDTYAASAPPEAEPEPKPQPKPEPILVSITPEPTPPVMTPPLIEPLIDIEPIRERTPSPILQPTPVAAPEKVLPPPPDKPLPPPPVPEKIAPAPEKPLPPPPEKPAPVPEKKAPIQEKKCPVPEKTSPPPRQGVTAEAIFRDIGLDAWFNPEKLHPKVESLVYWRSPAKSGIALGAGLVLLLALACCSLISVFAYTSLLVLTGTVAFRVYSSILQAVQKTSEGHPFKDVLEADLSIKPDRAQEMAVLATAHFNAAVNELRRLFLVEDFVDSLKFGVSLWCLTYLGAWFNGMTLLIIGYVGLFTLPKVYETNKAQIDANMELMQSKVQEIMNKVKAAIPIGKKGDSDKDK